jgi:prepilin peptidase CpaA
MAFPHLPTLFYNPPVHLLIPQPFPLPILSLLIPVAAIAAYFDIRYRRIPNALSLAGALAGLIVHLLLFGWPGLARSAAGLILAFAVYLILYLAHAMGGGDVKLMAALGAIAGPADWLRITALAWLAGAIFALLLATGRRRLLTTLWNVAFIAREWFSRRAPYLTREDLDVKSDKALRLPHGVSIAVGVVAAIVLSLSLRA